MRLEFSKRSDAVAPTIEKEGCCGSDNLKRRVLWLRGFKISSGALKKDENLNIFVHDDIFW